MFYICVICDCVCVLKYAIYLIWPRQFSFGPDSSHLAHVFLIWLIPWPEQKMSQRGPCNLTVQLKKKNVFKMLIFLFLGLLCFQSKAAVAIIHMYMYNNLLILKLPWLSRHARATVQTKFKLPITARTDICLKKNCLLKNIYVSSYIGSFGNKLEHALQCNNNIHSVISASVYNTSHSC